MTFIARLALALALHRAARRHIAQRAADIRPVEAGCEPDTGKPAPAPVPGTVFRPTTTDVTPPPAPPPTTGGADWGNSQVDVAYTEPQDPQFRPIRERLMRRQVLEQLRLFLSPLRLPRKLLVQLDQCNAERRPYQSGGPVTICYEYVAKVDQHRAARTACRRAAARNDDRWRIRPGRAARGRARDLSTSWRCRSGVVKRMPPTSSPASSWCSSARRSRSRS